MFTQLLYRGGARHLASKVGVRFNSTVHQFESVLLDGTKISLSKYAGKVVLIENTAAL